MKKLLATIVAMLIACTLLAGCQTLDNHSHTPQTEWSSDGTNHYHKCNFDGCMVKLDFAPCTGGNATCTERAICEKCANPYGEALGHSHSQQWSKDDENHWRECVCGDKTNVSTHNWTAGDITTNAGCTTTGKQTYTCACGATKQEDIFATGHSYTSIVTAPTCEGAGYTTYTCSTCGDSYTENEVDALGHSYTSAITNPTCTTAGYTTHTCTICGDSYTENEVDALGHSYTSAITNPTCTTAGYTTYTCSTCGDSYTENEVDALGHKVSNWSIVDSSVSVENRMFAGHCQTCNELAQITLYQRLRHLTYVTFGDSITYGIDGVDWGLMEDPYPELVSKTLNFASFSNLAVSGATFCQNNLNRTNMTQKILSFAGQADIISLMLGVNDCYVGLPLGTPDSRDNTTIYGSLFLISEYLTNNFGNSFIFYMTPFPAKSCYADNSAGYNLEDVANAIKHVASLYDIPVLDMYLYSKYESVEMHNPDGDGLHPSQSFMRDYVAPQISSFIKGYYGVQYNHTHTEVIDEAVDATCTTTGLTQGTHCSVCYKVIVSQQQTPIIDHSYSKGICINCGANDPNYINPDTHQHNHTAVEIAPTCTQVGTTTYTCECGDTYTEQTSALGHIDENLDIDCDREGCTGKVAPKADSTLSLATANALGSKLGTDRKYYVVGKIVRYYTEGDVKNGIFWITDENGVEFLIRMPKNEIGELHSTWEFRLLVGDTIKIYGKVGKFTTSSAPKGYYPCVEGGLLVEIISKHTCDFTTTPATCFEPAYCLCLASYGNALGHADENCDSLCNRCTLPTDAVREVIETHYNSIKDTANFDTTKGTATWKGTEFDVVVDKGTSSLNTNGTNHYRVQNNNNLTVSATNGKKIVALTFVSSGSTYVDELELFLQSAGYTFTTEGNNVTIKLEGVDSVTLANTSKKVARIAEIYVFYVDTPAEA